MWVIVSKKKKGNERGAGVGKGAGIKLKPRKRFLGFSYGFQVQSSPITSAVEADETQQPHAEKEVGGRLGDDAELAAPVDFEQDVVGTDSHISILGGAAADEEPGSG